MRFEKAFPYEETEDQLRAIDVIKDDMESARPMDRLLCGDVGYGKTEVALRAAFKATLDGKQVMVLVPTTILAQQHYGTFRERFADFPVKVEMISRFRSAAEQKRILADFAAGRVDVLIGTHRLLSQDVKPKDLGLVIVDEEQRFGVAQKEALRRLKVRVDVLTLTATPIPRTLQMSLSGVRDVTHHRDAAARPASHPDLRGPLRRGHGHPGHRAGDRPGRPGLLPAQPGGDHRQGRRAPARP